MGRGKTPWENMDGHDSVLKNLNKSPRRRERESRTPIEEEVEPIKTWNKIFWWTWRVGLGIDVGLILMVIYSYLVGWI
jgi:hypothetical protein